MDPHSRFVARLWDDLQGGYLGADFVAARIAELDRTTGDIDTLQGRIAAIRSWAYICQRPDWVLARDEMAARARGVEAKLSDALHARLTERFVNRRTTILMKSLGQNADALPVHLEEDGRVTVKGEVIGRLDGFQFAVDPNATVADRKMLLAAGEKAMPGILAQRAEILLTEAGLEQLEIAKGKIQWQGRVLADIAMPDDFGSPRLSLAREISMLPDGPRARLEEGLTAWLIAQLEPLAPLRKLAEAALDPNAGSQARALLITLIDARGVVSREKAGLENLPKEMRPFLRKLGVTFGALDIFSRDLLKPAPRRLLHALGLDTRPLEPAMLPVLSEAKQLPSGYRPAGKQIIRVDLAEKILRAAFDARAAANEAHTKTQADLPKECKTRASRFHLDLALAVSIGLEADNAARLLGSAGFRLHRARKLAEGALGPPAPDAWAWRPRRADDRTRFDRGQKGREGHPRRKGGKPNRKADQRRPNKPDTGPAKASGAFDALADLLGK
ncbi:MAG: hypothetical protein AAFW59_10985 [Pseudomonadota bacterium]